MNSGNVAPSGRGWRGRGVLVAVLAVLAGTLVALPTPAVAASDLGYPIRSTGRADSGWVGARVVKGELTYRVDPTARNIGTRYRKARPVADLAGRARPSARASARAACVLATFGGRRDRTQAAAVDAATYHLLAGGPWRLGKARGKARIRQTGADRRYVRSYARSMLSHCAAYAGPYRTTLTGTPATVGSSSRVVLTVLSARGRGIAQLPVTFRQGSRTWTAYTNSEGQASAYVDVTAAGRMRVVATASRVPESRLVLRSPRRAAASAVAVGGRLTTLTRSVDVLGTSVQSVVASPASGTVVVPQQLTGSFRITGGTGLRSVTQAAYGPFSSAAGGCSGAVARTVTSSVSGSGSFPLSSWSPSRSGYYRWGVAVGGNDFSTPTSTCSAPVRVQRRATTTQFRPSNRTKKVSVGQAFDIGMTVAGFDRSETHRVEARLYGPFTSEANVSCRADKLVRDKTVSRLVSGNGSYDSANVSINQAANAGYYIWQTTLSSGDLILGGTSACSVIYRVVP